MIKGFQGTLSHIFQAIIFKVSIIDPCVDTIIYTPKIESQLYTVGDKKIILKYKDFNESLGICGPFSYSLNNID